MHGFKTIEEFTLEECEAFLKRNDISGEDRRQVECRKRQLLATEKTSKPNFPKFDSMTEIPFEQWTRQECEEYLAQYPKSLWSDAVRKRLESFPPAPKPDTHVPQFENERQTDTVAPDNEGQDDGKEGDILGCLGAFLVVAGLTCLFLFWALA